MDERIRVAYQGERGAFSENAARRLLGGGIELEPRATFDEMFESVSSGAATCCVAPIENSLAGSIHRNYDLLLESNLAVVGETTLRIVHNLIGVPNSRFENVRRVYSHPVALAQCTKFFREHHDLEAVPAHDTAGAVRLVMERQSGDEAAIASSDAAAIYGGSILERGIEDHRQNYTRFFLLTQEQNRGKIESIETARRWKTSLVFRTPNKPGALFHALGAFAMFGIDLAKIESRPVEGRPWEYAFYLDLIGRADDTHVARAIDNLAAMAEMVKVIGTYPTRW